MLKLRMAPILATSLLLLATLATGCKKEAKKETPAPGEPAAATAAGKEEAPPAEAPVAAPGASLAYLPASCDVALHLDVASLMAHPAVAAHVVPALNDAKAAGAKAKPGFGAFLAETGMDPVTDFREVALCIAKLDPGGPSPQVVGVATGNLKPGLTEALQKTSTKKDKFTAFEADGVKGLRMDKGMVGQLANGTLLGGNSEELFNEMLTAPNGVAPAFAKVGSGNFRVVVPQATVQRILTLDRSPFRPLAEKISGATSFVIDLGKGTAALRIATVDEKSATEFAGVVKLIMGQIPKEMGGVEGMLLGLVGAAEIAGEGADLVMRMNLPAEMLEGLAKKIGANIREELE